MDYITRRGGVNDYQFGSYEKQERLLASTCKGVVAIGGNRTGKTVSGGCETVWRHLGRHPFKTTHKPPIHSWCISQTLPLNDDTPHTQRDEVRRWAPPGALRGGSWGSAYSQAGHTIHWANGGKTEFKSYDQDLLKFESAKLHWVWFDEEPLKKAIWTSSTARLIDFAGQWMMTLTPVLSLQAGGWVEETLWDKRAELEGAVEFYEFSMRDNPYLPPEEIEAYLTSLGDGDERAVREHGTFAKLGGRVLSEYDPAQHRVAPFMPPLSWRHILLIDFGWRNATAGLFAAIDPEGAVWLYAEHYQKQWRPARHMLLLNELWKAFGKPDIEVLADPSGFDINRTPAGHESPAEVAEFLQAAKELEATWFKPKPAYNGDKFALRVKRYLATDRLKICDHLTWWDWEARKWGYQRERETLSAAEQPTPEGPVKRDNHLMDLTRYLCNELPEPLPRRPEPIQRSAEAFVAKHLDNAVNRHSRRQNAAKHM